MRCLMVIFLQPTDLFYTGLHMQGKGGITTPLLEEIHFLHSYTWI